MTDRIQVDYLGVARAADVCRTVGAEAGRETYRLLGALTKEVIEAAAGHDDYGKQITDGWVNSHADTFDDFGKAIGEHLIGRGDQMSSCGENIKATDGDASQQVRAADLGLTQTPTGWAMTPADGT
ncbi:hypothetical protein [Kribbella soli]|uniref:WXG100 family type VII secretion target n=1 Tax=Kribbella soli TaxID=1124743 RepID=A0A4R0H5Y1_9ACTN|nr:hypothetical protein [Kribbella soli]TCC04230.1 hypothetical protein E0H45_34690 [Kribbella soli]